MRSAKPLFTVFLGFLLGVVPLPALAASGGPIHALWVWKSPMVLAQSNAAENLRDFCRTNGVNEVYLSVAGSTDSAGEGRLDHLISVLHAARVRVDALFSSTDADEGGEHLDKLLAKVGVIATFNQKHPRERFDGIHLDIEPQQRPENKGTGNLAFLPGLVNAYKAVKDQAAIAGLPVNADIQTKLLKGNLDQRKMLLTSLPALTLMLYELSSPTDGQSTDAKAAKLRSESQKYLQLASDGLDASQLAKISIGLRTPDYEGLLPQMLKALDDTSGANPMYGGWARHSYNDVLEDPGTSGTNQQ
jgi:hypothetical protein